MVMGDTAVLGLGNLLRTDEGLGVVALQRLLDCHRLPDAVRAIDGGTLGLDLISHIEGVDRLLVLDAVLADSEPGTLVRLDGEAVPVFIGAAQSAHDLGLATVLAACRLRGSQPSEVVVLGMQPETCALGWGLSERVADALDDLVDLAIRQLQQWELEPCMR